MNNFQPHSLNQKIQHRKNSLSINYFTLKKLLKSNTKIIIIFVHSKNIKKYTNLVQNLKMFQKKLKKSIKIFTLNKMKNDIDGKYYKEDNFFIIKNYSD